MPANFTPLASGSRGNACLLDANGGILIDAGRRTRDLAGRLAKVGRSWHDIKSVLLTHTHGDHWTESALARIAKLGLSLYCHDTHVAWLAPRSPAFAALAG